MNTYKGKKTYIVCALMVVYAVVGYALSKVDGGSATELVLEALAIAGLRAGVAR